MKRCCMAVAIGAVAMCLPSAAAAQPAQNPSQGPMTIERLHSGFLFAGDVKISDLDRDTGVFVGGQAGWVLDEALFMGGGAYFLTNGDGRDVGYGGFVFQYTANATKRVGFGGRALLGGGWAELPYTYAYAVPNYPAGLPRGLQSSLENAQRNATSFRPATVWYSEGFFVAEPEATVSLRVTRQVRLMAGVGYRFTSSYYSGFSNDRLNGVTGSISVQVF